MKGAKKHKELKFASQLGIPCGVKVKVQSFLDLKSVFQIVEVKCSHQFLFICFSVRFDNLTISTC